MHEIDCLWERLNMNDFGRFWKREKKDSTFDADSKRTQRELEASEWLKKGLALEKLGRFDEAIKCYDKALKINPQYAEAWVKKGISFEKLSRSDEAIKCYDKAIEINPQDADAPGSVLPGLTHDYNKGVKAMAWCNKGSSLHSLRRFEEAIKCYDKTIEISPRFYVDAWFLKGSTLRDLGRFDEAIKCLDKVLLIQPKNPLALVHKAMCEDQLGLGKEAAISYRKLIEVAQAPEYANLYANIIENAHKRLRALEGS